MPAAKLFGEPSRLIQMYSIANMRIYFGITKERGKPCEKAGRKNGQELNIKFPVFSLNYTNS